LGKKTDGEEFRGNWRPLRQSPKLQLGSYEPPANAAQGLPIAAVRRRATLGKTAQYECVCECKRGGIKTSPLVRMWGLWQTKPGERSKFKALNGIFRPLLRTGAYGSMAAVGFSG